MAMQLPLLSTMNRLDQLWQDLRYASRSLRKSPGYTIAAVLLLALGIGATTTIFSVVYALLLHPLPYRQPQQLVSLLRVIELSDVSIPEYQFWKDHSAAYSSVAAYRYPVDQNLDTDSEPQWIQTVAVTSGFFRTLGIEPSLGREFDSVETAIHGPRAIILTDGLWHRAFGGRADILGRTVTLDDVSYTVAGVLPPSFWFSSPADAFVPLQFLGTMMDSGANTVMIGRLKIGITLRQAEAESSALTQAFVHNGAQKLLPGYRGLTPVSYQDSVAGHDTRTRVLTLFGAVLLLLLIACSNLAGLLLARLASKRKEIAVRLALGSSTPRLLRQYLLENALLSLAGCAVGLLAAAWLLQGLLGLVPFHPVTPVPIALNRDVLLFTIAASIGTNLAFGLVPLLASSRIDIAASLKSGDRGISPRQRMRSLLVAGEVALSATLLISAALLIQSLYRLHQEKLGFSPDGVMTFATPPSRARRGKADELRRFEAAVLERIQKLPGVRNSAGVNMLPFVGPNNFPAHPVGHPEQEIGGTEIRAITPGYFETMRISVLRGRQLTDRDTAAEPLVALVSESLSRRWWPQSDPIGQRVIIGEGSFEVVGVVADTKRMTLKEPFHPTVYLTPSQYDLTGGMYWVMRGTFSGDFADRLQEAIHAIDPRQRVVRIKSMDDLVAASTADSRFDAWIFGAFAGVALLLSAIGVYGLLAFSVARRTHEIGTRMALGASGSQVLRLVLRQGIAPVFAGLAAGLAGAFLATHALSSLLFGVQPRDRPSFAAASILLLIAGTAASYLPARRATKVDPMIALRSE